MTDSPSALRAPKRQAGSAKPLTSKGQRTRTAILDAAERQFAERGFDGVSLRQIIDEAGVQMGQLQYYFPAKEDVFVSVLDRRLAAVGDDYREAVEGLEAKARVAAVDLRTVIAAVLQVSRRWLASDDRGRHRYLRMLGLATMSFDQPDYVRSHGLLFRPLNERIVAMMLALYPEQAPAQVVSAYHLIEANLLSVYVNLDALFVRRGEARSAATVNRYYDELEAFLDGGCRALLGTPPDLPQTP